MHLTTITTEHQCKSSNLPKSKLKIAHLNVRSLKTRSHLLQVRELMREKDYDVLAVSESWLNSTVEIDGYKLTRLDRRGKSGGGVCVYTRSSLKVKRLKDMYEISESGFHQLWIQIQLKKLRSVLLFVAYRPEYCPLPCFVNNFMDKYTQALTFGKDILVAGDLNCDMLKPHSPEANALLDLCNSVNLTQLIKEPTQVTENSSTLIDVIMTSSNNIVEDSGVVVSHISEHFLVYTSLKLKLPKSPSGSVNIRSYIKPQVMIKCQHLYLRMLFHVFFQFLVIFNRTLLTSVNNTLCLSPQILHKALFPVSLGT